MRSSIVWAVDPLSKAAALKESALAAIELVRPNDTTKIIPTYVANIGSHALSSEDQHLGTLASSNLILEPLQILEKPAQSARDRARTLVRFAKKNRAEMIVLSTHARQGPTRWFLGSFAEALSLVADVPLFIAPPDWKPRINDHSVLFLTDFGEDSRAAFEILVAQAAKRDWSITIYNRVGFRDQSRANLEAGALLRDFARSHGVHAQVDIDQRWGGDVSELALRLLRKGYQFVALAARSSAFAKILLGATTRRLIRYSPVPVWVVRPELKPWTTWRAKHFARTESAATLFN